MTSMIILWKRDDQLDMRIASDDNGRPLLFEFMSMATKYAFEHYGPDPKKQIVDMLNYNVVAL